MQVCSTIKEHKENNHCFDTTTFLVTSLIPAQEWYHFDEQTQEMISILASTAC